VLRGGGFAAGLPRMGRFMETTVNWHEVRWSEIHDGAATSHSCTRANSGSSRNRLAADASRSRALASGSGIAVQFEQTWDDAFLPTVW
jgi:hypothetical protein